MRQRIRLTEGDLHRIVKESVERILKEEQFADDPLYNEWDDYDMPDEYYDYRIRMQNGDYSKEVIDTLLRGIRDNEAEALDAYEYAKREGVCPRFVKQAENIMSWSEFDREAGSAEMAKKRAEEFAYNDNMRFRHYEDAPDENANRFNVLKNPYASKGSRKPYYGKDNISMVPNGEHVGVIAQGNGDDKSTRFARALRGTRRSTSERI